MATSSVPPGIALIGSTSMTVGEVVAPTSPAVVSTPSAVCREEPALVSVTGGEVVNPSANPRIGVAVRASSASASPRTCGSSDLVREGDDGATVLHDKNTSSRLSSDKKYKDSISSKVNTSA
jgi:xanthosine utilization system XapX-like protein